MKSVNSLQRKNGGLDAVDIGILTALGRDARVSTSDLARSAHMSAPSIADRVRRLEAAGVIRGYSVEVDPAALGFTLSALIRIRPLAGQLQKVAGLIADTEEVVECHRTTGDDCFVATAHLRDVTHLEQVIDRFTPYAQTNTSIVQSSPVRRRLPALDSRMEPGKK
jgi:Lrp/AsnC family transcriptional regulator, leucine-responsive regulatory protein